MQNLNKVNALRKLAKEFGNPLVDITFTGEGAIFQYKVGNSVSNYSYSNADRGIAEEIERFEKLLAIEL